MTWRRKSETDDDLHEAIMEATARAIVKHGVSDLTVRNIGAEFDRSRTLINYHYNSKDDLLATFVEYTVEKYLEELRYDPDVDPAVQLDQFVRSLLFGMAEMDETDSTWCLQAAQYALRPQALADGRMQAVLAAGFDELHETLSETVAAGIDQGVVDAEDPDLVASLLLGIIDSARGGKLILGDEGAPERMYRALTRFVYPSLGIEPSA